MLGRRPCRSRGEGGLMVGHAVPRSESRADRGLHGRPQAGSGSGLHPPGPERSGGGWKGSQGGPTGAKPLEMAQISRPRFGKRRGPVFFDECRNGEEFVKHDRASITMEFRSYRQHAVGKFVLTRGYLTSRAGWPCGPALQYNPQRNIFRPLAGRTDAGGSAMHANVEASARVVLSVADNPVRPARSPLER